MQTNEKDRAFLESVLPDLQDFLLSKELFWPAGTQHGRRESVANLPQLSLGNIRLATARLLAKNENINDAALAGRIDPIYTKWRSNWGKKAALEYSSRLRLWKDQLNELINDPSDAIYRYEIRTRVILELLKDDLFVEPPGQEQDLLAGLDALLRASSIEDQFVWDAGIMGAFSKEQFWFLYRHIQLPVGGAHG
jgi:hypothetical protein